MKATDTESSGRRLLWKMLFTERSSFPLHYVIRITYNRVSRCVRFWNGLCWNYVSDSFNRLNQNIFFQLNYIILQFVGSTALDNVNIFLSKNLIHIITLTSDVSKYLSFKMLLSFMHTFLYLVSYVLNLICYICKKE